MNANLHLVCPGISPDLGSRGREVVAESPINSSIKKKKIPLFKSGSPEPFHPEIQDLHRSVNP